MSNGQQTFCSAHSYTDATARACTASTHYSSHSSAALSETTPATASNPEPGTAPTCSGPPTTVCCSFSVSHSTPARCGGPPCRCAVTAPACCPSTSVIGSPSSDSPHTSASAHLSTSPGAPATDHCAAPPSDHAGAASQSNWRGSLRCNSTTEHQQPKCGHLAAGKFLPNPVSCKRGNNQPDTVSAYCNNPGTQSGCTCPSESSGWHVACCCAHCSTCCVHSNTHNQQFNVCHFFTECWGKAAGAHSPTPCSASN